MAVAPDIVDQTSIRRSFCGRADRSGLCGTVMFKSHDTDSIVLRTPPAARQVGAGIFRWADKENPGGQGKGARGSVRQRSRPIKTCHGRCP